MGPKQTLKEFISELTGRPKPKSPFMRLPHLTRTSILMEILSPAALGACSVTAFRIRILPKVWELLLWETCCSHCYMKIICLAKCRIFRFLILLIFMAVSAAASSSVATGGNVTHCSLAQCREGGSGWSTVGPFVQKLFILWRNQGSVP